MLTDWSSLPLASRSPEGLKATDLTHWEKVGQVFGGIPSWARAKVPKAQAIWAPDVSFFDGAYHLYYAVSEFATNRSVIATPSRWLHSTP